MSRGLGGGATLNSGWKRAGGTFQAIYYYVSIHLLLCFSVGNSEFRAL